MKLTEKEDHKEHTKVNILSTADVVRKDYKSQITYDIRYSIWQIGRLYKAIDVKINSLTQKHS